jgi:preprotein translocase SecE subunit
MALAVKTMPDETAERRPSSGLFVPSLLGALYVFGALAVLASVVPSLWASYADTYLRAHTNAFVSGAGLIAVEFVALVVLFLIGRTFIGGQATPGLKAGIFTIAAGLFFAFLLMSGLGGKWAGGIGEIIAVAFVVAIFLLFARFLQQRGFEETMRSFEHQGWFTATGYKTNQGRKVRRATLLGFLILAGAGVYTLLQHQTLAAMGKDWTLRIPFSNANITVLPDVKMTLPLLLAAAAGWLSYRLVNVPVFAEFLIATEGELNKVAWPTRKSLMQDTVVVLTTVVLMTVFLFVVDIAWGKLLSNPYVGVLRLDPSKVNEKQKDSPELDW